jgi:peptidoglycan hydrolase-like protein with peptidoglycan-binding domain
MIIDYSTARPTMAALRTAGVTAVGRYLGWDCQPGYGCIGKNITKTEATLLRENGIAPFLCFEYAADGAANGANQGHIDGQLAYNQVAEIGAPPTVGVYFAVDYDIPDYDPTLPDTAANAMKKLGPVGEYFQSIKNLHYSYRVGVYGGYYAVKRVLDAGLATLGWQTVAWSGGQRDTRAVLYQTTQTTPIPGADTDIRENAATSANFGQWAPGSTPPPTPTPPQPSTAPAFPWGPLDYIGVESSAVRCHSGILPADTPHVKTWQQKMKDRGWNIAVDGMYGPASQSVAEAFQGEKALSVDGKVGPVTWKASWADAVT